MQHVDDEFYERADQHIQLSNEQITDQIGKGKVSASMLYATSHALMRGSVPVDGIQVQS
ncbi:MAG: DUF3144 domain-containing protein [Acinetobacter parvus]